MLAEAISIAISYTHQINKKVGEGSVCLLTHLFSLSFFFWVIVHTFPCPVATDAASALAEGG